MLPEMEAATGKYSRRPATKSRVAVQDTVQKQGWQEKALADAQKAKDNHSVNRFLFFTNRAHQQITITDIENQIENDIGVSATLYEGRGISELILQKGLEDEFLDAIGEPRNLPRP